MSLWIQIALISLFCIRSWGWSHIGGTELQKLLSTQDHTLVAFIGSDNAPTQQLDEEWASVSDADGIPVSVDCELEAKLCEKYDVRSFPAIRLYRSEGTVYDHYRGPRLASQITAFVKRSLRPTVSGLVADNVTEFGSLDDSVFVLHLTDADASKGLYRRFHDVAAKHRDCCSFGVLKANDQDDVSTLDCYNNVDDVRRSTHDIYEDFNLLKGFFDVCTGTLVPEMTHANKKYFIKSKGRVMYYFDFISDNRDRYSSNLRETAKKHISDLEFVTVDPASFPDVAANLGLKWDFPAIALRDKDGGLLLPSERNENIMPDFVEGFLQSVTDDNHKPTFQDPHEPATKEGGIIVDTHSEEIATHDEL